MASVAVLCLLFPGGAAAQPYPAYHRAPTLGHFEFVPGGSAPGEDRTVGFAALVVSHDSAPLSLRAPSGDIYEYTVEDRTTLHLRGGASITPAVTAWVDLGWVLHRGVAPTRDHLDASGMEDATVGASIGPFVLAGEDGDRPATVTIVPYIGLPVGDADQFTGYGAASGGVLVGYQHILARHAELGAAVGTSYEPGTELRDGAMALHGSCGVLVPFLERSLGLGVEYVASLRLSGVEDSHGLFGTAWVDIAPFLLRVSAGASFTGSVGTSPFSLRATAALRF